jgi:hypothetical protein
MRPEALSRSVRLSLRPLPDAALDPRQRHRLAEIIANLGDRITEARASGWLGEVQGLQVSLDAARAKLASLAKAEQAHSGQADLGIPTIRGTR